MDLFEIRKKLSMGMALQNMKLRVTDYSRVSTDHMEQRKSLINQKIASFIFNVEKTDKV